MGQSEFDRECAHSGRIVTNILRMREFACLLMILGALDGLNGRLVVKYLDSHFLLPDGCPNTNPVVQEFYTQCLRTHNQETLCSRDRLPNGYFLTMPKFSNICSAMCHGYKSHDFKKCPYPGRILYSIP